MNLLEQLFLAPLQDLFFQKALLGGVLVALVAGPVGCLVILRRMAFLGDALSHAMVAGVAGGYLAMKLLFGLEAHAPGMLLGSLLAALLTVGLIGLVGRVGRLKEDTAIGIMYTGVFAAGVVLVSLFRNFIHIDLLHFIMGDVLAVSDADLKVAALTSAAVLTVLLLFFRHFQAATFDPVMAASIGIPVALLDYALTTCVSLVVVSAVSMVGVILVVGLLITPAATAFLLTERLHRMMGLAALFGATGVAGGLYACVWLDSAGGGTVMLFTTFQFLAVLVVAPRHGLLAGWLRRRAHAPRHAVEDLLTTVLRTRGAPADLAQLRRHAHVSPKTVRQALAAARAEGLLEAVPGGFTLTPEGRAQAVQVLRAHRLWESYLGRQGEPEEALHGQAHRLEHLNDPAAVAYLDDLLGHPMADPHGAEIPADPAAVTPGRTVAASLLRTGARGRVVHIGPAAAGSGLRIGAAISAEGRRDGGATWVFRTAEGTEVALAHPAADDLRVEVLA